MRLYQLCGQIDERDRHRLRIRFDGAQFPYGSGEYILNQQKEVFDEEIVEQTGQGILLITCYSKPQPKEKTEREEIYTPEKPQNPHIGV